MGASENGPCWSCLFPAVRALRDGVRTQKSASQGTLPAGPVRVANVVWSGHGGNYHRVHAASALDLPQDDRGHVHQRIFSLMLRTRRESLLGGPETVGCEVPGSDWHLQHSWQEQ